MPASATRYTRSRWKMEAHSGFPMRALVAQATVAMVVLIAEAWPTPGFTTGIPATASRSSPLALANNGAARVQGTLVSGSQRLVLSHGVALLHDGAEGLNGGRPQLRLLLSDRAVDADLLQGPLPELPLQDAARRGTLRAVLVTFDPANPDHVEIEPLLAPGPDASAAMASLSITRSGGPGPGAFDAFNYRAERLQATFTYTRESSFTPAPTDILSLTFQVDLPVRLEPAVTAKVKGGVAVRATPQGRAAMARARAMANLDSAGLARLRAESPGSLPLLPAGTPEGELIQLLRSLATDQLRALDGDGLLLVERGDRAVLVIGEGEGLRSWITFRRRNGSWLVE